MMKAGTSTQRVYDGTPFRLIADDFTVSGLPSNSVCELDLKASSDPVKAGDQAEITVSIKSLSINGKSAESGSYSCSPLKVTISVTPRSVNVSAAADKVYDGTALSLSNAASVSFNAGSNELLPGHRIISASSTATITDAGTTSAAIETGSVRILDGNNTDVTSNYQVIGGSATLTVTRRPLTIRTSSAVKVYDGTALTDHTAPTVTGLLPGHRLPITFTGKQEKAGSSANTIKTDFKITSDDKDVTKNYDISFSFGTLTVLKISDTTYEKGSKKDISLHLDVEYSDFRDILMDGEAVDSSNYTSSSGSTVVTLKGSYLESLKAGEHSLTVRFKDANDMKIGITVKNAGEKDKTKPRTGDDSHIGLFIGLALASLLLIVVVLILLKNGRKKKPAKRKKK